MKKLISIILALLLAFELIPTCVFADSASDGQFFYSGIGDSIAAGWGLGGEHDNNVNLNAYDCPTLAYPRLVANSLVRVVKNDSYETATKDDFANLGAPGYMLSDFYDALNDEDGDLICGFWKMMGSTNEESINALKWSKTIRKAVEKSDLITFQVGANDVLVNFVLDSLMQSNPLIQLGASILLMGMLNMLNINNFSELIEMIAKNLPSNGEKLEGIARDGAAFDFSSISNIVKTILGDDETKAQIKEFINYFSPSNMTYLFNQGIEMAIHPSTDNHYYKSFIDNGLWFIGLGRPGFASDNLPVGGYGYLEATIASIHNLNPEADIAIVSSYNPFASRLRYDLNKDGVLEEYTNAQVIAVLFKEIIKAALTDTINAGLDRVSANSSYANVSNTKSLDFNEELELTNEILAEIDDFEKVAEFDISDYDFSSSAGGEARLMASNSSSKKSLDELAFDFTVALLSNIVGGITGKALGQLDDYGEAVANKYSPIFEKESEHDANICFIDIDGKYRSELDLSVHPAGIGHEDIAEAICDKLIFDVKLIDNKNGQKALQKENPKLSQAVYGQNVTVKIPSGADYLIVNGNKVWDKSVKTNQYTFTVTEDSYVYAHYNGSLAIDLAIGAVLTGATAALATTAVKKIVDKVEESKEVVEPEIVIPKDTISFYDVFKTNWFYDDVKYVFDKGLMSGVSSYLFEPNTIATRAMVTTILYRLAGEPAFMNDNIFKDVESGSWYEKAVVWASGKGIVNGIGNSKFSPNSSITREQLATMLYNYAKYMDMDTSLKDDTNILSYDDANEIHSYAIDTLSWAVGSGIIQGSGTKLMPTGEATRAQLAAILARFDKLN